MRVLVVSKHIPQGSSAQAQQMDKVIEAIQDYGGVPVLTGSSGSIQGRYENNGAIFEGTYPLGSGVYLALRIECFMDSTASMYGTNENEYWGTNTVTGEMIKLGIESWKFRAAKRQAEQ